MTGKSSESSEKSAWVTPGLGDEWDIGEVIFVFVAFEVEVAIGREGGKFHRHTDASWH